MLLFTPTNHDIYVIGWRVDNAAGMRVQWNDIVTGVTEDWLCCPFGGILGFVATLFLTGLNIPGLILAGLTNDLFNGPTLLVRVPVGEEPRCIDQCNKDIGGKNKFKTVKVGESRTDACSAETPLASIQDNTDLSYKQIFNSPETSFGQPFLGDVLKVENVMFGGGKGHFVEVKDNAKYKLLTKEAQEDALKSSEDIGSITPTFNATAMFTAYQAYLNYLC